MVETYIKEIEERLQKIQKENEENINQIIDIETSTDYCVGNRLVAYGRLYKTIFYSKSYEEVIQKLESLKKIDIFFDNDEFYDNLIEIQNTFIEDMKEGVDFDYNSKENALSTLEHEYIFDTILKCL